MHRTMNHHSVSTRSSYTWSLSSTPWTAFAGSTAPYPSHAAHIVPCTFYRPPQAASALIHLVHAPDHGYSLHWSQQAQL